MRVCDLRPGDVLVYPHASYEIRTVEAQSGPYGRPDLFDIKTTCGCWFVLDGRREVAARRKENAA